MPRAVTTSCSATGQKRHDELIAEATSRHDTMLTQARDQSTGMVEKAQQQKQAVLAELGRERDLLQKKIAELRSFERDYRARLKSYLESQLHDLEATGADSSAARSEGDGRGDSTAPDASAPGQQDAQQD